MPNINPFPVETFQSIFDSFLNAMKWIRTPAVFAKILPFIVVVGVVGAIVFGFLWLGFRAFSLISQNTFRRGSDATADIFVSARKRMRESRYDLGDTSKIKAKKFELDR